LLYIEAQSATWWAAFIYICARHRKANGVVGTADSIRSGRGRYLSRGFAAFIECETRFLPPGLGYLSICSGHPQARNVTKALARLSLRTRDLYSIDSAAERDFTKQIGSKKLYKNLDQKSKTDFFSIYLSRFWAFFGEGSSKTR
jgi:hypothetical protein